MTSRTHLWVGLRAGCALLCGLSVCQADDFVWEDDNVTSSWNAFENWSGTAFEFPDDNTDSALISIPDGPVKPRLESSNIVIGALTLRNSGDLNTGDGTDNFALTVQDSLFHNGDTLIEDVGSSLTVFQSPVVNDFDTDTLTVDGGSLILRQGAKAQVDVAMTLTGGGDVFGDGILELQQDNFFRNDGLIRAAFGGTLTVQRTGTATIDLDGLTETGALWASDNSTLIIDMPNTGGFDGTIDVDENAVFNLNSSLFLNSAGVVDLDGGNGTATLTATGATVHGDVNANSGTVVWDAPATVTSTATMTVATGATLQFDATTTINEPESLEIEHTSGLIINDVVNVGSGTGDFNWDGFSGLGTQHTTVNPGAALNIDVDRIENFANENYEGHLTINSGTVDVQNTASQWELGGTMEMNNTGPTTPWLDGDQVLITGNVQIGGSGGSRIAADSIFGSTSSVNVDAGATLFVGGSEFLIGSSAVINGGAWTGEGTVSLASELTTISGMTTVNMPNGTFDIDGSFFAGTVAINDRLTLNVASVDDFDNAIDDATQINGAAGQLNVQFTNPDTSYRFDGSLELNGPAIGFTGVHLAGADVELAGMTEVLGSSTSHARVDISGVMNIGANSEFNFQNGDLANPNIVRATSSISGPGELIVRQSSQLNVEDSADIDVAVVNGGRLEPGLSIGTITMRSYDQGNSGTLGIELSGAPLANQDRVFVDDLASVDGELEVTVLSGPMPTLGVPYTLLVADSVAGTFDTLTLLSETIFSYEGTLVYPGARVVLNFTDVTMFGDFDDDLSLGCADVDALVAEIASGGADLSFDLNDDGMISTLDLDEWLSVAGTHNVGGPYLPGDADLDGNVNGADFVIWNANKFTNNPSWCSGDFTADGFIDGADFVEWNAHKFMSSDVTAVPESVSPIWLCVVALWMLGTPRSPTVSVA